MYQWRREFGIASQGDGYERVWNAAPIDSSGYSPGHANPSRMPLENRRWWSESATLDGKPLGSEVLRAIGEWRVFRPNFSRLPSNLAATFQPEGDGLGSSENPLDPQIGDLRVSWRELRLPPLEGKLELREGVWRLRPEAAAAALNAAPAREPVATAAAEPESGGWSPGWFAVAVVLALIVLYRLRKRRQARR
ncbi:TMEM43 family protein [Lysobacter gummosus]